MPTRLRSLLSPEARLLLLTAGSPGNDEEIAALARAGIEWRLLTRIAESERAEPVLVRRLRAVLRASLPPEAIRLEQLARVADFRQAWIEERLAASVAVLATAGIEVVLLKGAALALSTYRSFIERPMADLDFLVPASRAEEAHRLLMGAGWAWSHNPHLDTFYSTHHHLAPLHDARGVGIGLDLHTMPVCAGNPFGLDGELMRRRAVPVAIGGATAYLPDDHDQLLHLCVHFAWSHLLSSGAWRAFRDVGALVGSGRIEWDRFVSRARQHRAETCAYWVLRLSARLTGLDVPDGVLRALRPARSGVAIRALERHYVLHLLPSQSMAVSVRVENYLWEAGIEPRRMGHGPARPWDRTAAFAPAAATPGPNAAPAPELWRIRAFADYTRAMIGVG